MHLSLVFKQNPLLWIPINIRLELISIFLDFLWDVWDGSLSKPFIVIFWQDLHIKQKIDSKKQCCWFEFLSWKTFVAETFPKWIISSQQISDMYTEPNVAQENGWRP